jgi:hypothetical protein
MSFSGIALAAFAAGALLAQGKKELCKCDEDGGLYL